MLVCVGLFGHSAVVFHVLMFFFMFFHVLLTVCVVVFFHRHFIDLFSCLPVCLINLLAYVLTNRVQRH